MSEEKPTSKAVSIRKKAAPALKKAGTYLTPMNIALFGVGTLALYFGVKGILALFAKTPEEIAQDNLDQAIIDQQSGGVNFTFPLSQYDIFADTLEEATDTAFTDEDSIYTVFNALQNNADLLQLIKAYGQRYHFEFGIPLGNYTLSQVLVAVLSQSERDQIQSILNAKGITITLY